MILASVFALFAIVCGASVVRHARLANKSNALQLGIGVGVAFFLGTWIVVWLVGLIFGAFLPFYGQITAQLIASYIMVVLVGARVCEQFAPGQRAA